ncbi:sigma 54-interacting transcriptional regulator [Myxococcota bacterium]|nr:sigma 54-interacting transcriptional regulator [Myxococcota bacterium]
MQDLSSNRSASSSSLEKWNAELAFRPVVEATSDRSGIEFLRQLVKSLAQSLNVQYAFVAEFAGAEDRVRTLAFWSRDDWRTNVEYRLSGTPCERVVAGEFCLFKDDVQALFPYDSDLVTLGARSYLGVPLRSARGQTLGHLAALDCDPMIESPRDVVLFEVFANRARVELERLHAEAVMQRAFRDLEVRLESTCQNLSVAQVNLDLAYGELQALLEINQLTTKHLRRADLFVELARSVKPLLACERFGIELPTGPDSLRVHVLALDQPARGPMIEEFPSAGTACRWAQEERARYVAGCRDSLRDRFPTTFAVMEREGMESLCAIPLLREEKGFGALFFMSTKQDAYLDIPTGLLDRVGTAVAVAVDNCSAYEQVAGLRDKLLAENAYLQEEIQQAHDHGDIVGRSPAITKVLSLVDTLAETNSTVLILGETGTGKELVARALHERSPRRERPLVKVNCSAISAGLVESELFGHVKGAFTGAVATRIGRFEVANGGTLFLDEVGELPLEIQVKLLRALQEREIEPVGSNHVRKVDVRVIAATHRDLATEVEAGRFRKDLYFRLNVVPIVVPPLRERPGDVELLAFFFAERFARDLGKRVDGFTHASLERLREYDWPGNVRELSNVVERAVVLARGAVLEIGPELTQRERRSAPFPEATRDDVENLVIRAGGTPPATLDDAQRHHILTVLLEADGLIEGATGAAARLGIKPSTLRSRMKKLGIRRSG